MYSIGTLFYFMLSFFIRKHLILYSTKIFKSLNISNLFFTVSYLLPKVKTLLNGTEKESDSQLTGFLWNFHQKLYNFSHDFIQYKKSYFFVEIFFRLFIFITSGKGKSFCLESLFIPESLQNF